MQFWHVSPRSNSNNTRLFHRFLDRSPSMSLALSSNCDICKISKSQNNSNSPNASNSPQV